MPLPTYTEFFDDGSTTITAVNYTAGTKTLALTFSADVNPVQAGAAIIQAMQAWLAANTDQTINMATSSITRNTSSRNSVVKDQLNLGFQLYLPPSNVVYDPTQL